MFLLPTFISKISDLNFFPLHASHGSETSGMNCISIKFVPSPLQFSHLPPSTLNEKCFGLYPLIRLSRFSENTFLISS